MTAAPPHSAKRSGQNIICLLLLLAAIFCRGVIADGFMPEFHAGKAPRMAICYGGMDAGRSLPSPHPDQDRHEAPCPYMAMAIHTPVTPVIIAVALPEPVPFRSPVPAQSISPRHKTGASPRGPPSSS